VRDATALGTADALGTAEQAAVKASALDFDAIAHDPRVGYPPMSPGQLAEVLRADEERWAAPRAQAGAANGPRGLAHHSILPALNMHRRRSTAP
jgi:hypothetical protein